MGRLARNRNLPALAERTSEQTRELAREREARRDPKLFRKASVTLTQAGALSLRREGNAAMTSRHAWHTVKNRWRRIPNRCLQRTFAEVATLFWPRAKKDPVSGAFRVAGAGFEPATSGL
jgi:hypothetical protein